MAEQAPLTIPDQPRLTRNITHFARALRVAGLPAGPDRVTIAIQAVEAAGFTSRQDFFVTLRACFTSRPEHLPVFAQLFRLYWRDPQYLEHMMSLLRPIMRGLNEQAPAQAGEKRAAEALLHGVARDAPEIETAGDDVEIEIDATLTMSGEERLRSLDFEQMSVEEMAQARRVLARLELPVPRIPTRRTAAAVHGPLPDWRRSMRVAMRRGGELERFERKKRRKRWPALVCLCDISGSMSAYSRAALQYLHAVANRKGAGWAAVHAFTFGTRLTNISRHLRQRDVDAALAAAGAEAQDWEGGTRIGACLHSFNRDWSRRVLGQGAVVVLITDGLERATPDLLAAEAERLHLSCRHLIWVNPLLRFDGFLPKAGGMRALLPHVDTLRAGHNIAAIEGLAEAIARPHDPGEKVRLLRSLAAAEA